MAVDKPKTISGNNFFFLLRSAVLRKLLLLPVRNPLNFYNLLFYNNS